MLRVLVEWLNGVQTLAFGVFALGADFFLKVSLFLEPSWKEPLAKTGPGTLAHFQVLLALDELLDGLQRGASPVLQVDDGLDDHRSHRRTVLPKWLC